MRLSINVFPTRVGVNRTAYNATVSLQVFPTRVGVNRNTFSVSDRADTFSPHAWG